MQKPKDKKMNKLWSFILLIALAITIVPLYAQASSKITGKVTDKVTEIRFPVRMYISKILVSVLLPTSVVITL